MAIETITRLIDDVDGKTLSGVRTVPFSFDGSVYEIDLTDKHTEQMRQALQPWLDKARRAHAAKARARRSARRTSRTSAPKPTVAEKKATNDEIRAWAKEHGLKVADKGRIPNSVIEQFQAS